MMCTSVSLSCGVEMEDPLAFLLTFFGENRVGTQGKSTSPRVCVFSPPDPRVWQGVIPMSSAPAEGGETTQGSPTRGRGTVSSRWLTEGARFEICGSSPPIYESAIGFVRAARRVGDGSGPAPSEWNLVAKVFHFASGSAVAEMQHLSNPALKHPNIVQLVAATQFGSKMCVVLPRYIMDSLSLLQGNAEWALGMPEDVLRPYFRCVARAVAHLHIKPENVLVDEAGHAVLADFGDAVPLAYRSWVPDSLRGTKFYHAPELVEWAVSRRFMVRKYSVWRAAPTSDSGSADGGPSSSGSGGSGSGSGSGGGGSGSGSGSSSGGGGCGTCGGSVFPVLPIPKEAVKADFDLGALDVWALGCTLYALLTNSFLIIGETRLPIAKYLQAEHRVKRGWSKDVTSLLEGMLQLNPRARSTSAQVLRHPWLL